MSATTSKAVHTESLNYCIVILNLVVIPRILFPIQPAPAVSSSIHVGGFEGEATSQLSMLPGHLKVSITNLLMYSYTESITNINHSY